MIQTSRQTSNATSVGRKSRSLARPRGISFVGLLVFLVFAYAVYFGITKSGDKAKAKEAAAATPAPLRVIIYTKPSCEPCDRAKAWLTQRRIPFEDRDVEFSTAYKEQVEAYKSQIVPVIVVNGEPQFGFLSAHLEDVIEKAKHPKP